MAPKIINRDEIIVVGIRDVIALNADTANALWRDKFMPRHQEVAASRNRFYGVYSILPPLHHDQGDRPGSDTRVFRCEYVAGMEGSLENVPTGMVTWVVPSGNYASFEAQGLTGIRAASHDMVANWLPDSGYRRVESPMYAYTDSPHPESPDTVWCVNIPVELPEILAQLEKWLG